MGESTSQLKAGLNRPAIINEMDLVDCTSSWGMADLVSSDANKYDSKIFCLIVRIDSTVHDRYECGI